MKFSPLYDIMGDETHLMEESQSRVVYVKKEVVHRLGKGKVLVRRLVSFLFSWVTKPWVLFVVIVYCGALVIWSHFYRTSDYVSPIILNLPLLLTVLAYIGVSPPNRSTKDNPGTSQNIRPAVVATVWVYVILYFGGGGIFSYASPLFDDWSLRFLLILGPLLFLWLAKEPYRESLGIRRGLHRPALVLVIVALLVYGAFLVALLSTPLLQLDYLDILDLTVSATLLPAITEEMIFRGLIQSRVTNHTGSRLSGVMVSSLLFSLTHVFTDAPYFENDLLAGILACLLFQFVGGLILGGAYAITNSIAAPVVIHYFHNAYVWVGEIDAASPILNEIFPISFSCAIFVSLLILVVKILDGGNESPPPESSLNKHQKRQGSARIRYYWRSGVLPKLIMLILTATAVFWGVFYVTSNIPELVDVSFHASLVAAGSVATILVREVYDSYKEHGNARTAEKAILWDFKRNFVILCKEKVSLVSTLSWDLALQTPVWKRLEEKAMDSVLTAFSTLNFFNYEISFAFTSGLHEKNKDSENEDAVGSSPWFRRKQALARNNLSDALWNAWPRTFKKIDWNAAKRKAGLEKKKFYIEPEDAFKKE